MNNLIAAVLSIWIGSMFLYTGALKLVHYRTAVASISQYRLVPRGAGRVVAYGLPWVEIGVGVLLLASYAHVVAGVIALGLGAVFAVLTFDASRARNTSATPCGCTGRVDDTLSGVSFARAIAIVLASGVIVFGPAYRLASPTTVVIIAALSLVPAMYAFAAGRRVQRRQTERSQNIHGEVQRLTELLAVPPE